MLYAMYVHLGDDKHAHGVTMPDFPGCFSAADSWDELPTMILEAVELYFEGEDLLLPKPTPLEKLTKDSQYEGGVWLMIDIDLSRLSGKAKRVNITLPERVLASIDDYVAREGGNRSAMLANAAMQFISEHRV